MSIVDTRVVVGVSIGEIANESAIAVLYRHVEATPPEVFVSSIFSKKRRHNAPARKEEIGAQQELGYVYHVRGLKRPAGDLADVVDEVVDTVVEVALRRDAEEIVCILDSTGVGHPVFAHLFNELDSLDPAPPIPIRARELVVTNALGGSGENGDGALVAPRRDLISAGRIALRKERLKVSKKMGLAPVLKQEFREFSRRPVKVDALDPWRLGPNDDLVLACLSALYASERILYTPKTMEAPDFPPDSPFSAESA